MIPVVLRDLVVRRLHRPEPLLQICLDAQVVADLAAQLFDRYPAFEQNRIELRTSPGSDVCKPAIDVGIRRDRVARSDRLLPESAGVRSAHRAPPGIGSAAGDAGTIDSRTAIVTSDCMMIAPSTTARMRSMISAAAPMRVDTSAASTNDAAMHSCLYLLVLERLPDAEMKCPSRIPARRRSPGDPA